MVTKNKTVYVCSQCGYESPKWQGRCPDCGNWNTFSEEIRSAVSSARSYSSSQGRASAPVPEVSQLSSVSADESLRCKTGMGEFDRVLGGGIVPGAVTLVCGDPGIGKSTVLLQMCRTISPDVNVLYVSGEESMRQVRLRANRLGVSGTNVLITSSTDAEAIREAVLSTRPGVVIIDSIQTISISSISSSPGSVTQIRESAQLLINCCKDCEIPVFFVGHVNKDGAVAGPKILEHMVDTVLYFEGDRNLSYRILRSIKNRYGSTNEIGVFEMKDNGLIEVDNPSEMLLAGRPIGVSGSCVTCLMEGTRPLLVEVQALASKTPFGNPRRLSAGFDINRTALLIAVLEKRAGFFMGNLDVYINVAGGMRIDEPSADLSVALAILSNLTDKPLPTGLMALGEMGLAGEIRSSPHAALRISEGYRLGFNHFIIPRSNMRLIDKSLYPDAVFFGASTISEAAEFLKKITSSSVSE